MSEGLRISNRSSLRVYEVNQNKKILSNGHQVVKNRDLNSRLDNENPYDINLLNHKGNLLSVKPINRGNTLFLVSSKVQFQ